MRESDMAMSDRRADLRRYPRAKVTWPVILELENRSLQLETVNLSPMGTKVRVDEPLEVGKTAKLHFHPPNGRSLDVDAIVWRADRDGSAFFFVGLEGDDIDFTSRPVPQSP
jgi:hypothetical protein